MGKPVELNQTWVDRIVDSIRGMEFGSVQITVHAGQIVQIERTEKKRFELQPEQVASRPAKRSQQG